MPLYAYECATCGRQRDGLRKIEERNDAPNCYDCKVPMALIISPVTGIVKNPAVPRGSK